ncbi:sugar O-acetyltransferase [Carnobacterium mobile]|uniref:sugar O-acetyltransferase n=1 Tax=Carnobacterium mobile TaxID=2750 RepID=UPI0005573D3E|nr:sugar O-acetyltransferase [Carnobacterium mobile]
MQTEKEKMIAGELYDAANQELREARKYAQEKLKAFHQAKEEDSPEAKTILKKLFGSTGEQFHINQGLIVDYGFNVHIGENFYANFNCTLLDICPITIGKNCMLAPNVQLYTATHPLDPIKRNTSIEYGKPITLGDNVWVGGGAIIIPGVTLGDNVVVGAGAVVTKSFPDNVVIGGNPARVIKVLEI